jgi:hypothetical protein
MEKLIKPKSSIEDVSDEVVNALCEYDGCSGNCRDYDYCRGVGTSCSSISEVESDDDILF